MPLDQMIDPKAQIQSVSELEQMIVQNNLPGQLKASLLSCKVDELSPATLRDYDQKLKALARFCVSVNVHDARAITASHIRLLLLKLQETCQPVSISDYYRCVKRFFNWMMAEGILEHNPKEAVVIAVYT